MDTMHEEVNNMIGIHKMKPSYVFGYSIRADGIV